MHRSETVLCAHCGQPIVRRQDLVVVGRSLTPLHEECLDAFNAGQPALLRSAPINRLRDWLRFNAFLIVFAALGATLMTSPSKILEAWPILIAANGGLLLMRLVAWFSYERRLN